MRGVRRFFAAWLSAGVLSACMAEPSLAPSWQGDEALCAAFASALPGQGLKPQLAVCYRENEAIPGGCATCLIGLPLPVQGATMAQMHGVCAAGLPCHAKEVRSPLRAEGPLVRHPAVVFDVGYVP